VQGFFAYRIYAFTKKLYIPIFSWSLSFVRFLGSVTIFATALRMTSFPTYAEQWGWLLTSVWCISAANDLTITTSLVTKLFTSLAYTNGIGFSIESDITYLKYSTEPSR
jgi:hypothetical protein